MTQRAYEWDPRPPTIGERIICGVWLVAFVPVMLNYYADWRLFRGYDKLVLGGWILASFFLVARLPGVKRVEGVPRPVTYWLFVCLGLAVAVGLWMLSPKH
jgi:hypothetical protein